MAHNRFSDFHCVYTFIEVVHTELIRFNRTEYPAFESLSKLSEAAAAVIIALISEENKSREKGKKEGNTEDFMKLCLQTYG